MSGDTLVGVKTSLALRASLAALAGLSGQFVFAVVPQAEAIARAHVESLNAGDPSSIQRFIKTYCSFDEKGWDRGMLLASKKLAPISFKKISFSAPYEFIAEVTDREHRTDHITFFLNSAGKVRYLITYPDRG